MNKNNVIVCSKNRRVENVSPSSVDIELSTPLKCADNEYFTVNIQSFNMIKSFYSIQNGLNNKFFIVMKGENGNYVEEFIRYIPEGNYNVGSLLIKLKELCFGLVNIEYDRVLNKFKYTKLETSDDYNIEGYDMYIRCENCGIILGFHDGVEKLINTETISDYFVNVSGYTSLILKLGGLSMSSSYINMVSSKYDISRMIGIVDIASVMPMDSIIYNSDLGDGGKYKITDKIISRFSIDIVNENNVIFPQMSDYILNLVFEKHTHPIDYNLMFNSFMERFNDLMYYISYLFQYFNIGNMEGNIA